MRAASERSDARQREAALRASATSSRDIEARVMSACGDYSIDAALRHAAQRSRRERNGSHATTRVRESAARRARLSADMRECR
jgi:hypothetical protein